jgi:hypothetical protein
MDPLSARHGTLRSRSETYALYVTGHPTASPITLRTLPIYFSPLQPAVPLPNAMILAPWTMRAPQHTFLRREKYSSDRKSRHFCVFVFDPEKNIYIPEGE